MCTCIDTTSTAPTKAAKKLTFQTEEKQLESQEIFEIFEIAVPSPVLVNSSE